MPDSSNSINRKIYIRQNSFKAWSAAARPKTLSGAAAPVLIACAASISHECFNIAVALLALLFALLMQIDANFINDLLDCLNGRDTRDRLGPRRSCAQGWITVKAMKRGIVVVSSAACTAGLLLLFYSGPELIIVGMLCLLFAYLYTGGPYPLSYHGLGDLLVIVFFGIVPVCCTFYIMSGSLSASVALAGLGCGTVIDTMLIINNYRDREEDKASGKHTLTTILGEKKGNRLYLATGIAGAALSAAALIYERSPYAGLILLPYLVLHTISWKKMVKINRGKALNPILGETSRNITIYAILFCMAYILS